MRKIADKIRYADGQIILKEGSYGDALYLILSGKVEVSKIIDGRKAVVAVLDQGAVLGELSFIDKKPRPATATAVGEVMVGVIDKEFLEYEVNKMSYEFSLVLNALAERLRKTTEAYAELKAENDRLKSRSAVIK